MSVMSNLPPAASARDGPDIIGTDDQAVQQHDALDQVGDEGAAKANTEKTPIAGTSFGIEKIVEEKTTEEGQTLYYVKFRNCP